MKLYTILLILIVTGGFAAIGLIIYQAVPHPPATKPFRLNTAVMRGADNSVLDSLNGPEVLQAFTWDDSSLNKAGTPCANLLLCLAASKSNAQPDTVLILNAGFEVSKKDLENRNYWIGTKAAPQLKACMVNVPTQLAVRLHEYPYKYCKLALWSED